jgi:hypothetical protein
MFLAEWGFFLVVFVALSLIPGVNAKHGAVAFSWSAISVTLFTLLIWSWRWFYVTGKEARRG